MTKPKRKKKTTLTLMHSDFKETPKTVVVSAEPAELWKRYYVLGIVQGLNDVGSEYFSDSLEEAFFAFTTEVADDIRRNGVPGEVILFDRRRRRLLTSSHAIDAEEAVRNWLE